MSYDLMVFNPHTAPKRKEEFLDWYRKQTEWAEDHGYDDPVITSEELRYWFMEMIQTFPAMNGPFASHDFIDEDASHITDYCIGREVIYIGFRWSVAEKAYQKSMELAKKHKVGFFDASGSGDILVPDAGDQLKNISELSTPRKPFWKFW